MLKEFLGDTDIPIIFRVLVILALWASITILGLMYIGLYLTHPGLFVFISLVVLISYLICKGCEK